MIFDDVDYNANDTLNELNATINRLAAYGENLSTSDTTVAADALIRNPYGRLKGLIENLTASSGNLFEEMPQNPSITRAAKSELVEVPYGIFRKMISTVTDSVSFEYDIVSNPLKIPKISAKLPTQEYTREDGQYLGPTKISLYNLHTTAKVTADAGTAAYTLPIRKAEYKDNVLTIYFHPANDETSVVFDSGSYNQSVPMNISDSSYDDKDVQIGLYIDPSSPGTANMVAKWKARNKHYANVNLGRLGTYLNTFTTDTANLLTSSDVLCCFFYKFLENFNEQVEKAGMTEALADYENYIESVSEWLTENKKYLLLTRSILLAAITIYEASTKQIEWPSLNLNLNEMLSNTLSTVIGAIINLVKEELYEYVSTFVDDKYDELQTKIEQAAEDAVSLSDLMDCVPLEEITIAALSALIGKSGFIGNIDAYVQRLTNMLIIKERERKQVDGPVTESTVFNKKIPQLLRGAVIAIDAILALNLEAASICANYNYEGSVEESGEHVGDETDTEDNTYTTGEGTIKTKSGPTRYSPEVTNGYQIDITNTDIDPMAIFLKKDSSEIEKLMTHVIGFSESEAQDAVSKAKQGDCLKRLSAEDARDLQAILNQTGITL